MNKFKNNLTDNLIWKIISLVFAVMLWFVGMNINNPIQSQTYTAKLQLRNEAQIEDKGLILLNQSDLEKLNIEIRVRGSRNDLDELARSDIGVKAYVDFKPIDITAESNVGKAISTLIYVEVPNSKYEILDYYPKNVDIKLDNIVTVTQKVEVVTTNTPKSGYLSMGEPITNPSTITLTGAESYLSDIQDIMCEVNISGADSDVTVDTKPIVHNSKNEDISKYIISEIPTVEVTVKIDKSAKIPIAQPTIVGEVAEGYEIVDVTFEPSFVEVVGEEAQIERISEIKLPNVNVVGATGDITKTFNLKEVLLEYDLDIRNGTESEATVYVQVQKMESRTLVVPSDNLHIKGLNSDMTIDDYFEVTVSGPKEVIDQLKVEDIAGVLDLSNMEEGIHAMPISVIVPNDVIVEDDVNIIVSLDTSGVEE